MKKPDGFHWYSNCRELNNEYVLRRICLLCAALYVLTGCSTSQPPLGEANALSAGQSVCVGSIEPPYGLEPIDDPVLIGRAVGRSGKGGVCAGKAFTVTQPITVYRVWDSSKAFGQYGSWWTFNPPAGPRDNYRRRNEICPSWSRLDRVTQCRLKVGVEIVIGPGQSAQCAENDNDVFYQQSADTQVYVPITGTAGEWVTDCLRAIDWP
ncbi:hypothetical protein SAMN05444172_5431 [Burkholderia sp. GAS332]|nr:hypothetical protein SAMN05444172_5431 [Burkholderia sp. GAS332]